MHRAHVNVVHQNQRKWKGEEECLLVVIALIKLQRKEWRTDRWTTWNTMPSQPSIKQTGSL